MSPRQSDGRAALASHLIPGAATAEPLFNTLFNTAYPTVERYLPYFMVQAAPTIVAALDAGGAAG